MFICSVKAGTVKLCSILLLGAVLLTGLILFASPALSAGMTLSEESKYSFSGVKTEEDRISFLKQFGWEVKTPAEESTTVTIPAEFDRILLGYNELQRELGLDLTRYKKKTLERYTYEVLNYNGEEGKVYANLFIYRGRVVGGDISSADPEGFVHNLEKPAKKD